MAETFRARMLVKEVGERISFGNKGGTKRLVKGAVERKNGDTWAQVMEGKPITVTAFSNSFDEHLLTGKMLDCDIEQSTNDSGGQTYVNFKFMQLYVNGEPVDRKPQQGKQWSNNFQQTPETRALKAAEILVSAYPAVLAHRQAYDHEGKLIDIVPAAVVQRTEAAYLRALATLEGMLTASTQSTQRTQAAAAQPQPKTTKADAPKADADGRPYHWQDAPAVVEPREVFSTGPATKDQISALTGLAATYDIVRIIATLMPEKAGKVHAWIDLSSYEAGVIIVACTAPDAPKRMVKA